MKISSQVDRKFVEIYDVDEWEVLTDTGWEDISHSHKTVEYGVWELKTHNGLELKCADNHIIFDKNYNEVFVKDLKIGDSIITKDGIDTVQSVSDLGYSENMYDLSVNSENQRYYTNDILSHNTQCVAAFILYYVLFNDEKTVAIVANKGSAAREIMSRVQQMFEDLPSWLQQGVVEWNKGSFRLENGSKAFTAATSGSGLRGKSVNLLYIDEFSIIPNNIAEDFLTATYPTISSGKTTKIVITSTPLGYNHFWHIWDGAVKGLNGFIPISNHYTEHPARDAKWAADQLELLGEIKYNQEVLCTFNGSSNTLISSDFYTKMNPRPVLKSMMGLDILYKPDVGRQYVMICDIAKGVGRDYSTIMIIDITDTPYKIVAKYRNNKISDFQFPDVIYRIGKEYNFADVLIEINTSEQVGQVLYNELEYENLIFVSRNSKMGQYVGGGFGGGRTQYGVMTDRKIKRIGCNSLKALIENHKMLVEDAETINEISTFIEKQNSFAADTGYHDDLVMCLVLFAWLSTQTYFQEMRNIDLRKELTQAYNQQLEENMLPIGWMDNGVNEDDVQIVANF